jgi:hypothetical protein
LYKEYNEKVPDILNSTIEGYQVKWIKAYILS